MARPKTENPRIEVKIRLTPDHLAKLDLLSLDPMTRKLAYGLRNEHIESALNDYFAKNFPSHT